MTTSFPTTLKKPQNLLKACLSKFLRCNHELLLIHLPQPRQVELRIKSFLPNYCLLLLKIPWMLSFFTPHCSTVPARSSFLAMALLEGFCCYLLWRPAPRCLQRRKTGKHSTPEPGCSQAKVQNGHLGQSPAHPLCPRLFPQSCPVCSLKVQASLFKQQQYHHRFLQKLKAVCHSLLSSSFWLYWNEIGQG